MGPQMKVSKDSKDLLNSRELQSNPKSTGDKNNLSSDQCQQALTRASEYSEYSTDSGGEWTARDLDVKKGQLQQSVQGITLTQVACGGKSSKSFQDSSNCIDNNVSVPKFSWFKSMSQIVGFTAAWHQDEVEGSPMGANTVSSAKANITSVQSEFNSSL